MGVARDTMRSLAVIMTLASLISIAFGQKEISCETIASEFYFYGAPQELKTCYIGNEDVYDRGFSIASAKDSTVQGFKIENQKSVKHLPENIGGVFPELLVFTVTGCSLSNVETETFKNLIKVNALILENNEITDVEGDAFQRLSKLEVLNLGTNRIEALNPDSFVTLKSLKKLWLSNNQIKFLPDNIFKSLKGLEFLHLDSNRIESIDGNLFKNLVNLRVIKLSGNLLNSVNANMFKNNKKLEKIWLNGNDLKFIDPEIFETKKNLDYVSLRNTCLNSFYKSGGFDQMIVDLKTNCQ